MNCYPEPESHIRNKVRVALDMSVHSEKKGSEHATGIYTSDLAAKFDSVAFKTEADKLDINWVGGGWFYPSCWFSFNKSEIIKDITLPFCSI